MQKLISFDLDMTLLDHRDYRIPKSTMLALEKLRKKGHKLVLATGRDMDTIHSKEFKDVLDFDASIELNGTKVIADGKMIYSYTIPKDLLNKILDYATLKGYSVGLTMGEYDYYTCKEFVDSLDKKRWGESFRKYKDVNLIRNMDIRTLNYIGYEDGAKDIEKHFKDLKLPLFAGVLGADIVEKNQSKAKGLKALCEYYNIDIKDTISFGDSMNDYEILKAAGIGVAMGNSVEKLKEVADYVTDDIDKDGIYKACIYLDLIDRENM